MSEQEVDEEPRSLLHLTAEQIATGYSVETVFEWLLQRNAHHRARLLAACQSLRAAADDEGAAYRRLAAAVGQRPTP
jgi:ATP-dependent exoDNAse (exonuclease V) beta subunit